MERVALIRKSKYGKLSHTVTEQYLRDDIKCGVYPCNICESKSGAIRLESCKEVYVPDDTFFESQVDMLKSCTFIENVVCLQSVLNMLQAKDPNKYSEVKEIVESGYRGFYYFANEHFKETFIAGPKVRLTQCSPKHYTQLVVSAFKWYSSHLLSKNICVYLLTNSDPSKYSSAVPSEFILTTDQFIQKYAAINPDIQEYISLDTSVSQLDSMPELKGTYNEYLPEELLHKQIKEGKLLVGRLNVNRLNPQKATIRVFGLEQDIYINGEENINRAISFDTVAVQILPESKWISKKEVLKEDELDKVVEKEELGEIEIKQEMSLWERIKAKKDKFATGAVVGIIKKGDKTHYCGSVDKTFKKEVKANDGSWYTCAQVIPYDNRIPRIIILTKKFDTIKDKRLVVSIDSWSAKSKYPRGHFVRTIGVQEDVNVESEVILLEHGVEIRPFSKRVLDCLPEEGYTAESEDLSMRRDCRSYPVCSIDPIGCKDIDDALHCRKLPNGNIEVGVHIADVSHYVKPNTALDKEAAKRCTTVYLVERRTDMLPKRLTEIICSLVEKKARLVFSVFWEFQPVGDEFRIVNTTYSKSVIKSVASLNYYEAQEMVEKGATGEKAVLVEGIRTMLKIAKYLKEQRSKNGALTLASTEVRFTLSTETHNPVDVSFYKTVNTHALVEEFMLLANIAVAAKIYQHYPTYSVLRRHPAPKLDQLSDLGETLKKFGFELKAKDSGELSKSLDKAKRENDPFFNKLIRIMTTRTMNQAVYFCTGDYDYKDFFHYGLATPIYTHFTSPIRRYADILVHRLLAAALDLESLPDDMTNRFYVTGECNQMNRRHRMAQFAGRASATFHNYLLFKSKPATEEAVIMQVSAEGMYAIVPRYGIEGLVNFSGQKVEFKPADYTVIIDGKKHIVFEHIMVGISATNQDNRFGVRLDYKEGKVTEKMEDINE